MKGMWTFVDEQILERLRLHGLAFVRDGLVIATCYVLALYVRFVPKSIPNAQIKPFAETLPVFALIFLISLYEFGIHRRIWMYAGSRDMRALVDAVVVATLAITLVDICLDSVFKTFSIRPMPLAVAFTGGTFALLALGLVRLWPRLFQPRLRSEDGWERVLIVGAGHGGNVVVADLLANPQWKQLPIGFLDDDLTKRKRRIHNVPVMGTTDDLPALVAQHGVAIVGVAIPSASTKQLDRIVALAQEAHCRVQVLPTLGEIMSRAAPLRLRDINLNDLLDRPPKSQQPELARLTDIIHGKTVLVSGAAGSIGSELCRQIMSLEPRLLVAMDNNETGLFDLDRDLREISVRCPTRMVLGDVTDVAKLGRVFEETRPQVIFHAAAYKHVPILEAHPEEAIFVNVQGTLNICRLASAYETERVVFISTDKAVHPVNVLGFSKRLGELITKAHEGGRTVYCSVRFGNVIGSRGSALPEFVRQIDAGGPVRVTHPDAERYFMTIPEAVNLVIQAGALAEGGETFMLDMGEPVKIDDLAKRIIRLRGLRVGADIEIVYTGLRPGEKLTEELVFSNEHTHETANPSIFAVQDDTPANMDALESWLGLLTSMAQNGKVEALRAALQTAAQGQDAPTLHPVLEETGS